jgi:hypothetical protein
MARLIIKDRRTFTSRVGVRFAVDYKKTRQHADDYNAREGTSYGVAKFDRRYLETTVDCIISEEKGRSCNGGCPSHMGTIAFYTLLADCVTEALEHTNPLYNDFDYSEFRTWAKELRDELKSKVSQYRGNARRNGVWWVDSK